MVASDEVFADSNYFVSSFNPRDTRHENALKISGQLDSEGASLVITNLIFAEVVTVLSQRQGRQTAVKAGEYLLSHSKIRVVHVDEHVQNEAWQIFREGDHKNISFVDCSTIAVMKSEEIGKLLTFDKTDFKKLQKQHRFSFFE